VSAAFVIRYTKRMCPIILTSVARPALPYYSTLSLPQKRHDLREKKDLQQKMCDVTLCTGCVKQQL
jgi:hypothetical protein